MACRVPELEFLRPSKLDAHVDSVDLDLDAIAAGVRLVRSNVPRLVQQCRLAGQTADERNIDMNVGGRISGLASGFRILKSKSILIYLCIYYRYNI